MKPKSKSLAYLLSLALISTIIPGNAFTASGARAGDSATNSSAVEPPPAPQAGGAAQALKQGRALLKRGKADLARVQLQNALSQF
jgi:hypothetical protein